MAFNLQMRTVLLASSLAMLGGCAQSTPHAVAIGARVPSARQPIAIEPRNDAPARIKPTPAAAEIFDFHPPGSAPGSWRQPFIVSYTEGPLNAYRVKTNEELQALKDHRYDLVPPASLAVK